jgi:hypothetical protein
MAITFTLAESTPHRLRYLCTNAGDTLFPSTGTLDNATLQTDAIDGTPMADIMATATADQAAARELLLGEGLTTQADINTPRCHCKLTPRNLVADQEPWAVDADAAANHPVLVVYACDASGPTYAYLDIEFEHTITR